MDRSEFDDFTAEDLTAALFYARIFIMENGFVLDNSIEGAEAKGMRKTKIICTIGPACENEETLAAMCDAGMNVARLNFSHGTHEEHLEKIRLIQRVREKKNLPIAIMLDTKGPEYRIKTFREGKITLKDGDSFSFTTRDIVGDETVVSVNYEGLIDDLAVGEAAGDMVDAGLGDGDAAGLVTEGDLGGDLLGLAVVLRCGGGADRLGGFLFIGRRLGHAAAGRQGHAQGQCQEKRSKVFHIRITSSHDVRARRPLRCERPG